MNNFFKSIVSDLKLATVAILFFGFIVISSIAISVPLQWAVRFGIIVAIIFFVWRRVRLLPPVILRQNENSNEVRAASLIDVLEGRSSEGKLIDLNKRIVQMDELWIWSSSGGTSSYEVRENRLGFDVDKFDYTLNRFQMTSMEALTLPVLVGPDHFFGPQDLIVVLNESKISYGANKQFMVFLARQEYLEFHDNIPEAA